MSSGFQGLALKGYRPLPESAPANPGSERRRSPRLPCEDGSIRIVVFLGPEPCTAALRDISTDGIGVLVDAIVAPHDWLNVEFHSSARGAWCCKAVQVIHAAPAIGGRWLVGGTFGEPLAAEELRRLMPTRQG